jgi:hypothetical protein
MATAARGGVAPGAPRSLASNARMARDGNTLEMIPVAGAAERSAAAASRDHRASG